MYVNTVRWVAGTAGAQYEDQVAPSQQFRILCCVYLSYTVQQITTSVLDGLLYIVPGAPFA